MPQFLCKKPASGKMSEGKELREEDDAMKILTLNTYSWVENVGEQQIHDLAAKIAEEDYDLVALQEANQTFDAHQAVLDGFFCPPTTDQEIKADNFALRLVEALQVKDVEYYWTWAFTHVSYGRFEEGVALLSKQPLIAEDHSVAPVAASDPVKDNVRRILWGLTEAAGQLVKLVSAHYNWWDRGFIDEWQKTEALLQASNQGHTKAPLILCGDFNQPAETAGYQLIADSALNLVDAYQIAKTHRGGTATVPGAINGWNDSDTPKRIDYIWLDPTFKVSEYAVTFDGKNGPVVSDHFGITVLAELAESK